MSEIKSDPASEKDQTRSPRHFVPVISALATMTLTFVYFPLLPILLAALAEAGRISLSQIGVIYTLLVISMGGASLLYGVISRLQAVRFKTRWSCALVALAFSLMGFASDIQLQILFVLVGLPLGMLLWIGMAGIVHHPSPAGMLGGLTIAMRVSQFLVASFVSFAILPYFDVAVSFGFIAGLFILGAVFLPFILPDEYATVSETPHVRERIPMIGWIALAAAVLIFASKSAFLTYFLPLANSFGLDTTTARQGMSVFLAGQIVGAIIVTLNRIPLKYMTVLTGGAMTILIAGAICVFRPSVPIFFVATAVIGIALSIKDVYILPMLFNADASRQAGVQLGTASMFAEVVGPALAAALILHNGISGALIAGGQLLLAGMMIVYGVEYWTRWKSPLVQAGADPHAT